MQRLDADKLLENLANESKLAGLNVFLCDDPVFVKIAKERFSRRFSSVQHLEGKGALEQFVDATSQGSLFGEPSAFVVTLEQKALDKGGWKEELQHLKRLPNPGELSAAIFAPTSGRHQIKEQDLKGIAPLYITYSPTESDAVKCARVLAQRFPQLKLSNLAEVCARAVEQYSTDLLAIDLHFERMAKAGLSFEDALLVQGDIGAFHVVDAFVKRDKSLVELRIQQCVAAGEDATAIFMALVYFLKQLAQVKSSAERTRNIKAALDELHVPYPSHQRMQLGVKSFSTEQLVRFFLAAPRIEMSLRRQKDAFAYLAVELLGLIA